MSIIKQISLIMISACVIFSSSCQKEDDFGEDFEIPAEYKFSGITSGNTVYAYTKNGDEVTAVPEEDMDLLVLQACDQVFILDDLHFKSKSELEYTAFDVWGGTGTRTEASNYEFLSGNVIRFTFFDEFGNDSNADFFVEGDELMLNTYAYLEINNGSPAPPEVYKMLHNQIIVEDEAASRAQGLFDGDTIYLMVYQQIYTRQ
jgi:hypothetical protein